jgi:Ca-activated chloride channel family protein
VVRQSGSGKGHDVIRGLLITAAVALAFAGAAAQEPSTAQPQPPAAAPDAPQEPSAQPRTTPAPQQRPPAFRTGIDIVSLNVTVADSMGRYVTDLTESEFQVFENGAKQDLTFFSRQQRPIALSLLLDSSASMENKLPTLQSAASNFVRRLKPEDLAQIIDFDGGVNIRQAFTASHADLERGIQQMSPGGSTALHNAIYIALDALKKVQVAGDEEPRRQALIVFSDGEDTSSLVPFEEVLERAKRSDTAIYTIGLRNRQDQRNGFQQAEFVLRQLALETGGRAFFPESISDLTDVYGQIADEIASQYSLGYVSKNQRRDGLWRPIVVQVTRPNLIPRTKKGYFAPSPTR